MDRSGASRREWLLAVAAVPCTIALAAFRGRDTLQLAIDGTVDRDTAAGIAMGIEEGNHTAVLLGRSIQLGHQLANAAGVLQLRPRSLARHVPAICMASVAAAGQDPCQFYMTAAPAQRAAMLAKWRAAHRDAPAALSIEDWHASLFRFGASEVNVRFERANHRPMSSAAWRGWCAVKALSECALQAPEAPTCDALRTLRFDAHKGTALCFDAAGQLKHPLYVVAHDVAAGRVLGDIA